MVPDTMSDSKKKDERPSEAPPKTNGESISDDADGAERGSLEALYDYMEN